MSLLWVTGDEAVVQSYAQLCAKLLSCPRSASPVGSGLHAPAETSVGICFDDLVEHPTVSGLFRHQMLEESHPLVDTGNLSVEELAEWLATNGTAGSLDPSWGL